MILTEEWRPAPGYEGRYEVSSFGRIRSLDRVEAFERLGVPVCRRMRGAVLNPSLSADGYPHVSLRVNGKLRMMKVHRLVCRAFHGEPRPVHREVAHLDGVRTNAKAANLKWVSKVENTHHMRLHGTLPVGEKHASAKLTNEQARQIRGLHGTVSMAHLAAQFAVSVRTIHDVVYRRRYRSA